ncbi:YdcF family protein [Kitasatospora sp. NPDC059827]|uniref:YdcF family protein n=1 Tax=Kitasatospora sp. NPDC059827 TaxID=3346964 RepID=UPI00364F54CC
MRVADIQLAITDEQWRDAQTIWDYHQMHHELRPCDAAIGLGSHDLGVPVYAAELYHTGLFPTLVFTGGPNPTHPERFPRGEAVHFREHALELGVPESAILLEPKATNTGQNISLSQEVLASAGRKVRSVMLIAMPYMERRAFATCRKLWPDVEVVCSSAPLEFNGYVKVIGNEKHVIDMLVGDMQRVIEYPKLGFAVEQEVPEEANAAYDRLCRAGFDTRLIKS